MERINNGPPPHWDSITDIGVVFFEPLSTRNPLTTRTELQVPKKKTWKMKTQVQEIRSTGEEADVGHFPAQSLVFFFVKWIRAAPRVASLYFRWSFFFSGN